MEGDRFDGDSIDHTPSSSSAPPLAPHAAVVAAARAAHVHAAVEALPDGYATRVGERGLKLSGGEKQRVALARAFLRDAPLLLADEATSALDAATEADVLAGLKTLAKGRTAIFVAHRLSTAAACDQIVVLEVREKEGGGKRGQNKEKIRRSKSPTVPPTLLSASPLLSTAPSSSRARTPTCWRWAGATRRCGRRRGGGAGAGARSSTARTTTARGRRRGRERKRRRASRERDCVLESAGSLIEKNSWETWLKKSRKTPSTPLALHVYS